MSKKFRLITRSDMDGLVCAVILKQLELIDDIKFVHPKDMQDGTIEITENDIITNLPYVKQAHMVFDHHESETIRNDGAQNHVIIANAPSAARVVYDYYSKDKAMSALMVEDNPTAHQSAPKILSSRYSSFHQVSSSSLNNSLNDR